jgi:hypothetical protein
MRKAWLIILAAGGLWGASLIFASSEAEAVVCARGVYRAGCAGPRGAVVTRRPAVRCAWVNGRRVCR